MTTETIVIVIAAQAIIAGVIAEVRENNVLRGAALDALLQRER